LAVVLLAGCSMPRSPKAAPTGEGPGGRSQTLGLTPRQELAVGRQSYAKVLEELQGKLLPPDGPETKRCRRVMMRLAEAAEIEPLQREINLRVWGYRFEWEVRVAREQQINAFCLPAGKMIVFTGILGITGDDDDFLATVLSHEMGHALAHHGSERVARQKSGESPLEALRYDCFQELEADHIGIFLMAFARFDPEEAVRFWDKMRRVAAGKRQPPERLSSHPPHEKRIEAMYEWAPKARAAKRAFDQGRVAPPAKGDRRAARFEEGDS